MGRLDVRYNVQLPINLMVAEKVDDSLVESRTSNIGLGGAFINADFSPPDGMFVKAEAFIPEIGQIELPGKVIRKSDTGFAIKFDDLNVESKTILQKYIQDSLLEKEHCPICHNYIGGIKEKCPFCKYEFDLEKRHTEALNYTENLIDQKEKIDDVIDRFIKDLTAIENHCPFSFYEEEEFFKRTQTVIHQFFCGCKKFQQSVSDLNLIKHTQKHFRRKSNEIFSKSHFMRHARTWPQGYVGDHKIIENIYRNTPLSNDIGYLLDRYFLSTALGKAVPARKNKMKEILEKEIINKKNSKILNLGCGSCRELIELAPLIKDTDCQITCLDFDTEALDFAAERIDMFELQSNFLLRKYNALKMINKKRNEKEFKAQDLIYSIGLLDYLTDDVLVRLFEALYSLLNSNGKLIAVFKDANRYETYDYHWLVEWDAFFQRTEEQSRVVLEQAGIPPEAFTVTRDNTGVILFYEIKKIS